MVCGVPMARQGEPCPRHMTNSRIKDQHFVIINNNMYEACNSACDGCGVEVISNGGGVVVVRFKRCNRH